jgi:hypothetical protein
MRIEGTIVTCSTCHQPYRFLSGGGGPIQDHNAGPLAGLMKGNVEIDEVYIGG